MKLAKVPSALDYRLQTNFEVVRKQLLQQKYAHRLEKPLAYWALPRDRRLPLAFLGRTVGDLVNTPFSELVATPGVGQKKMQSLVQLLQRATEERQRRAAAAAESGEAAGLSETPALGETPETIPSAGEGVRDYAMPRPNGAFDPTLVSELVWQDWCETIKRHRLGHEKLGRLAPSLQALPTVIWEAPLSTYMNRTLSEIRNLRTHGEKRVRVILEVFHTLHKMLSRAAIQGNLCVSVQPSFVPPLATWIDDQLRGDRPCSRESLVANLIHPLLEQLELDAGPTVRRAVAVRLGVEGPARSVRALARQLGVTRARVYQLFDECERVLVVRWPEGRVWFERLTEQQVRTGADEQVLSLLDATRQLCWPQRD